MKYSILLLVLLTSFAFSVGGVNPKNPKLAKKFARALYVQCEENSADSIDVCQKAILFELHVHEKMHKGVTLSTFSPKGGMWIKSLAVAEKETDYYAGLNFTVDTSLLTAMQGNANAVSMGQEMTSRLAKLNTSIESYSTLMHNVTKQSLIEFKIESAITELLYAEEMAREIKDFNAKGVSK